jgi:hypothetical protein
MYAPTTWGALIERAIAIAEASARDPRTGRSLLSEADRQALYDLACRLLLRFVDDYGQAFGDELPDPRLCARLVASLKRAVLLATEGARSIPSQAYGRSSVRAGDPADVDPIAPDPFSDGQTQEEARAILEALSERARMVLRVLRGEAVRPTDVPDRTWRRWVAAAIAEASDLIEARRR